MTDASSRTPSAPAHEEASAPSVAGEGARAAGGDGRALRVAVVGAQGYGVSHLRSLRTLAAEGRALLVATVDHRPLAGEAAELAGNAPAYRELAELLATEVPDIVTIATPIPSHAPLAELALRAGAHVLLEKPPTATLAQFEHLLAVASESGRACQVGFQSNGSGAYDVIAEAIAAGEIGEVTGIGVEGSWVRPTTYYERAPWAGRRRLDGVDVVDGVVTNPLAHAVATALRIDGSDRAEDVATVEAELFRANDIEADDTSSVRVITTRPTTIAFGMTLCAAEQAQPRVTVHGTEGRIVFLYKTDVVQIEGTSGEREVASDSADLLANLIDHVADPSVELLSPLAGSGAFMRVLEAIRTAPEPVPIAPEHVEWRTDDVGRHVVVRDVEQWCSRVAEELRTFTTLGAPWAPTHRPLATLSVDGSAVAEYVDGTGTSALDSPRPHLHPVRTASGVVVTDAVPGDHTWHAGAGLAVQDVAGHNLWGGRTYLPGRGYTWRADHGRITHEEWLEAPANGPDVGRGVERLAWRGHDGEPLLTETRTLTWAPDELGWVLGLESTLHNDSGADVPLGSPGSNGRENGGYGGFFWRLPASSDVDVRTPDARGEDAVHGTVAPWLAWSATAAGTAAGARGEGAAEPGGDVTLVFAGATARTQQDPWFVRVSGYPGVGSSLAWDSPLVVPAGGAVTRAFRVLVADGRLADDAVDAAAERLVGR